MFGFSQITTKSATIQNSRTIATKKCIGSLFGR